MLKIILGFLAVLYAGFIGYVLLTNNIALGVILFMIGLVIFPLAIKFSDSSVRISAAPDAKSYGDSGFGGGGNSI